MDAQIIAAAIAGFVSPFVQEILFGKKISGRTAALVSALVVLVIAALATWATGGFATAAAAPAFNLVDPSAFLGFWWKLWTPVYAIAQFLYAATTVHKPEGASSGPIQTVAAKVQPHIGTDVP